MGRTRKRIPAATAGRHKAQLTQIEDFNAKHGHCLRFTYVLESGGAISELVTDTPATGVSDASKLGKRARALLGELPDVLDVDDMIGGRCWLDLVEKPGSDFLKVTDVLPRQVEPEPAGQVDDDDADGQCEAAGI